MLFPKQNNYDLTDSENGYIRQKMEDFYQNCLAINQTYWNEADIDLSFFTGNQSIYNYLYGSPPINRQRQFNFNKIRRLVEMPGGYQRQHRKSTAYTPIENGDQQTADQLTKLYMWADRQSGISETISEAFTGALICGMNILQVWMDFSEDPISGIPRVSNKSYNSFLIDPYFKNPDMSDAEGAICRSYLPWEQCQMLLGQHTRDLSPFHGYDGSQSNNQDGKFYLMPQTFNYDQRKLHTYDEYYYKTYRTQKLLVDLQTGLTQEWKGNPEDLRYYLGIYQGRISLQENVIPTVNLAVLLDGHVMYNGRNPLGIDSYPLVPVMAYYTPESPYMEWRIQGIVRSVRDSQFLYNRRKVIELDCFESQVNSGWIIKEGTLVDPKSAYKTGQGQVLWVRKDAQLADMVQVPPVQISPSMMQLSESLDKEMMSIPGINEELLGAAQDDKAGILSMLRQGAGLTTLQRLFDQLDNSQKILGKILLKVMQENFTPGKVARIINEQPTREFYDKSFGTYDVAIEEGFNTSTQRQMQFAQMLHLREVGVPIPDEALLEAATIQNKNKIIGMIQQQQQQQQQQQEMQNQIAMQDQQAKIELAASQALAEKGLGLERMSRVKENEESAKERAAEAHKDNNMAILNMIKAMKELQSIDFEHFEKLLVLDDMLKQKEQMFIGAESSPAPM